MSIHLRWTKDGARRYDVRLRDPSGQTYTRTFRNRREAEAFASDERASRRRGAWLDPRRAESERLPAVGSTRTSASVHPPGRGTTRRSEPTSSLFSGTGRSGRSPRQTSNGGSTTGHRRWRHGRCDVCTRHSPRCSTPRCSTIGSHVLPVGESDCRPSNLSIGRCSPPSNWRISQGRWDQDSRQWHTWVRCSVSVGVNVLVSG